MWQVLTLDDGSIHVVPEDERERHEPDTTCPCGPRVEVHESILVVQDAFDGRLAVEWAASILNPDTAA